MNAADIGYIVVTKFLRGVPGMNEHDETNYFREAAAGPRLCGRQERSPPWPSASRWRLFLVQLAGR